MRSTYTYAVLEVSPAAHAEIKAKLLAAGYQQAINGDTIDMHGIALEPEAETAEQKLARLNIRKPYQCPDCGGYVVGGGCTCSVEQKESRRRHCHPAVRQPDPESLIGTFHE